MDEKLRNMTSIYNKRGSNAIAFPAAWQCCEDTWVGLRKEELGISEHGIRNVMLRYLLCGG